MSLAVRLTEGEVALLRAAAVQANVSVREWMRQQLLTAAQGPTDDLLFTEVVGLNLLMQTTLRWVLSSYALPPADSIKLCSRFVTRKPPRKSTPREVPKELRSRPDCIRRRGRLRR